MCVAVVFYLVPMAMMAATYIHIATVLWSPAIPGELMKGKAKPWYLMKGERKSLNTSERYIFLEVDL